MLTVRTEFRVFIFTAVCENFTVSIYSQRSTRLYSQRSTRRHALHSHSHAHTPVSRRAERNPGSTAAYRLLQLGLQLYRGGAVLVSGARSAAECT